MKNNKIDFLRTVLNWAVVLRADVKEIEKIKKFIASLPKVQVFYQTTDTGRLLIVRENERRPGP